MSHPNVSGLRGVEFERDVSDYISARIHDGKSRDQVRRLMLELATTTLERQDDDSNDLNWPNGWDVSLYGFKSIKGDESKISMKWIDSQRIRLDFGEHITIELSDDGKHYRWSDSQETWYGPAKALGSLVDIEPFRGGHEETCNWYGDVCTGIESYQQWEGGHQSVALIAFATELSEVLDALNNDVGFDDLSMSPEVQMVLTELPTFGGVRPADTREIWSWNETEILLYCPTSEQTTDNMGRLVKPGEWFLEDRVDS